VKSENTEETFSGFIPTRNLVGSGRSKPYKEKSKSKDKKRDWSKERQRKRGWDE
jgi:hypothetical protein